MRICTGDLEADNYELTAKGMLIRMPHRNKNGAFYPMKEIKWSIDSDGYEVAHVWYKGKRIQVKKHRVLSLNYIPNPNNYPQINHIDGNKLNNNLSNLEWCTGKHNTIHAVKTGLRVAVSGDAHYKRRLKCESVQGI